MLWSNPSVSKVSMSKAIEQRAPSERFELYENQ